MIEQQLKYVAKIANGFIAQFETHQFGDSFAVSKAMLMLEEIANNARDDNLVVIQDLCSLFLTLLSDTCFDNNLPDQKLNRLKSFFVQVRLYLMTPTTDLALDIMGLFQLEGWERGISDTEKKFSIRRINEII